MMILVFFIIFIFFYLICSIWQMQYIKSLDDFFIRPHSLVFINVVTSLVVTQLGSNMILDTSRKAFEYGIYGIFYPLGTSIGLLLLTSKIAEGWRKHDLKTVAEIFYIRYQSIYLQKFAGFICLISLMGILIAQLIALRSVICPYVSFAHTCLFVGTWLSIVCYTLLGGLTSVIATGFIQGLLIYGFFFLLIITILIVTPFSFSEILRTATAHSIIPPEITFNQILSVFILPGLHVTISQTMLQFIIKAKTTKIAKQATSASSLLLIIFTFIPFFCGLVAKKMLSHVDESAHVLVSLLKALMVPSWIFALGICTISAAIISTIDALLLGASSFIIRDIIPEYKHTLTSTRILIAILGLIVLGLHHTTLM